MDLGNHHKLLIKKLALQNRLLVEDKVNKLEKWWLDWYLLVYQNIRSCELIYLDCVQDSELQFWDKFLNQEPWSQYDDFTKFVKVKGVLEIHELLEVKHPGVLPLRYLPDAPVLISNDEPAAIFSEMVKQNLIAPQPVYVFFVRMSPVVQLDLYELMNSAHLNEIFPEEEDMVIMSLDGNWIIFKSLEQEWVYRNSLENQ